MPDLSSKRKDFHTFEDVRLPNFLMALLWLCSPFFGVLQEHERRKEESDGRVERYLTGLLWNVQVRGGPGLAMINQRFEDLWNP